MGSNQMYSLSWAEYGASLASTVQVLRGHGELVDVTLTAGGRIFPAHKLVLSAASPLLMELLKSTGCQHPVVMLAGVTAHDLEALLQFVYHGQVSVDPTQLPSLLQAAHCLDIQALSPNSLTSQKIICQSMSVMASEDGLSRDENSSLVSVRKRKRRQRRPCENGLNSAKWPHMESTATLADSRIEETNIKEESNLCADGSSMALAAATTKKLVSDQPVECTICGVVLKQSRNLRRHMALIHLKMSNGKRRRPKKQVELNGNVSSSNRKEGQISDANSGETDNSGCSNPTSNLLRSVPPAASAASLPFSSNSVGLLSSPLYHQSPALCAAIPHLAAPSLVMCDSQSHHSKPPPTQALPPPIDAVPQPTNVLVPQPTNVLVPQPTNVLPDQPPGTCDSQQLTCSSPTATTNFAPATMHHDALHFGHDSLFRHHSDLLRNTNLYNDTREQCATVEQCE